MQRATCTFFTKDRRVLSGELVADGDPLTVGRESYFEQVEVPAAPAPAAAKKTAAKKPPAE